MIFRDYLLVGIIMATFVWSEYLFDYTGWYRTDDPSQVLRKQSTCFAALSCGAGRLIRRMGLRI